MAQRRAAGLRFDAICAALEGVFGTDVGSRGIRYITLQGQLQPAAANFVLAPSTIILTGFPCRLASTPPTETDGPPGAVALAAAALALGKKTAVATDDSSAGVLAACLRVCGSGAELLSFPPRASWTVADSARLDGAVADYAHAVAIERAGRAADGSYRTMRGFSMDTIVAPIDAELLTRGCACGGGSSGRRPGDPAPRTSTGIGDGGNEAGMGAVHASCAAHIPLGEAIGCVVPSDALITAGVSNWGGWGLAAAAEALVRVAAEELACGRGGGGEGRGGVGEALSPGEEAVDRVVRAWGDADCAGAASQTPQQLDVTALQRVARAAPGCLLPAAATEKEIAASMNAAGAMDGITGAGDGSVDGMPLSRHIAALGELRRVLEHAFPLAAGREAAAVP